jgi:anti-anti-sigma factor
LPIALTILIMQILTHIQQNSYIIALSGTLDDKHTLSVQKALHDALKFKPKEVMVDCEELENISAESMKAFISTIRNLQKNQVGLVLISVNERINKLFTGLGLDTFMNEIVSTSLISSSEHSDIYFRTI